MTHLPLGRQAAQDAGVPGGDGSESELRGIPVWKAHRLTGLTFRIEGDEVADVNFEDYH